MVLPEQEIKAEFPDLTLDADESGYQDNEKAADDTIDPSDTAAELAALGRLDGYALGLLNPQALLGGETSSGSVFGVETSVALFDSSASAQSFMLRQLADTRRYVGASLEGVTIEEYEELPILELGPVSVAGQVTISFLGSDRGAYIDFITWTRGRVNATIAITAFGVADLDDLMKRLAATMNQRIDGVLTGEIGSAPIPSPTPSAAEAAARNEGIDLHAMLPTVSDLPEGAAIDNEGYIASDAISAYQREFVPESLYINLGNSQVGNISATVELQADGSVALGPVLTLQALDPAAFGELAGVAIAQQLGFTPETMSFNALDIPPIGDGAAGFLMKLGTDVGDLDLFFLLFARGRVNGEVLIIGPADQVDLADILPLAQLVDGRILQNLP